MGYRERLKILWRSQLFYCGALMFVVGVVIASSVGENSGAQMPAAILGQGGIIVGFLAYRRTRFVITDPARRASKQRRSRMGLIIGVGAMCLCFMLTPFVLWCDLAKMRGLAFWYVAATGFIGLFGLLGLFIWLKRDSKHDDAV
jgi:hypothetical protein